MEWSKSSMTSDGDIIVGEVRRCVLPDHLRGFCRWCETGKGDRVETQMCRRLLTERCSMSSYNKDRDMLTCLQVKESSQVFYDYRLFGALFTPSLAESVLT